MNTVDYTPSVEPTGEPMPWYEVWEQVILHPSRDSFRRILADPNAKPARAFIWVAVIGLIFGILQAVVNQVFGFSSAANRFGAAGGLTNVICVAIVAPIFSVIGLALGAAILRGVASLLKGAGNFNDLVYCLGALQAPLSIVSYLLSLIYIVVTGGVANVAAGGTRSVAGLCILPVSLAVGIYALVLQVLAIDTVEKFGTGKAVATVLIPLVVLILLGACVAVVFGVALAGILRQMGQ